MIIEVSNIILCHVYMYYYILYYINGVEIQFLFLFYIYLKGSFDVQYNMTSKILYTYIY
jgi:hypothetical protein